MIGTLEQCLQDMKNGVYDHTVDGKCSQCGQCCADFLPMSQAEVARIHAYVKKHGIKPHRNLPPTMEPVEDFTCPFRNELEKKCDIYEVRPAICRDFQCDKPRKQIEADKAMYHGKYSVVRMRQEFGGKEG